MKAAKGARSKSCRRRRASGATRGRGAGRLGLGLGGPARQVGQQVEGALQRRLVLVGPPVVRVHLAPEPAQRRPGRLFGGRGGRRAGGGGAGARQARGIGRALGPGLAMRKPCTKSAPRWRAHSSSCGLLDALDDGPDAEAVADLQQLAGDQVLDAILVHVLDELAVELDEVGAEPVDQVERGPAGAQVVERDAEAVAPVAVEHVAQLLGVLDAVGLDDLEDEALRRQPGGVDGGHRGPQAALGVVHHGRREVDEDGDVVVELGRLADGAAAGGQVELLEQAGLARRLQDGERLERLAVAPPAAQQRLVGEDLRGVTGVDDGVEVAGDAARSGTGSAASRSAAATCSSCSEAMRPKSSRVGGAAPGTKSARARRASASPRPAPSRRMQPSSPPATSRTCTQARDATACWSVASSSARARVSAVEERNQRKRVPSQTPGSAPAPVAATVSAS